MRMLALLVSALFVAGCGTVAVKDENSPDYMVPEGSRLVLHRAVTIPADKARIYFQGGRILPYMSVDIQFPHCVFRVDKSKEIPQRIEADEFLIYKVRREARFRHIRLASTVFASSMLADVSRYPYATALHLRSQKQPRVTKLTCIQWLEPHEAQEVSISEMRRSLGDYFTLKIDR